MNVGEQVPKAVQLGCGSMRHDRHTVGLHPLPRRRERIKLKPRSPQINMTRIQSPGDAVHAVRHAHQRTSRNQTSKGRPRHPHRESLGTGYQPPLILGNLGSQPGQYFD